MKLLDNCFSQTGENYKSRTYRKMGELSQEIIKNSIEIVEFQWKFFFRIFFIYFVYILVAQ